MDQFRSLTSGPAHAAVLRDLDGTLAPGQEQPHLTAPVESWHDAIGRFTAARAAVFKLMAESAVRAALYGGDDAPDLDAFDALDAPVADVPLGTAIRVGVRSGPREIVARADIGVDSVPGFGRALERLVGSAR